jgi:hypothetical protein
MCGAATDCVLFIAQASSVFHTSKFRLFDNLTLFVSCIIHILNTGCAQIYKKIPAQKCKSWKNITGTQWSAQEFFLEMLRKEFFSWVGVVQQIQLRIEGRENGYLGGGSTLVRGFTQIANECDPYSD